MTDVEEADGRGREEEEEEETPDGKEPAKLLLKRLASKA